MKFPAINDIATRSIVLIDTISKAIEVMPEHNHRNIVVINSDEFKILTALEMLYIKNENTSLDTSLTK